MILTLRTDSPDAEVGLYQSDGSQVRYYIWHANRDLAKDLLAVIHDQLEAANTDWPDVSGVIVFAGPGSFTGLRIGITVANAIAYAQGAPVLATQGEEWLSDGMHRLRSGEDDKIALPHYGGEAHITLPRQ